MMRHTALACGLSLAAALLAFAPSQSQAQVTMGRLFSTPAERATMEASRGAAAALAPNSQGQQPAPGIPGGPAPDASYAAGLGPGQPQNPGPQGPEGAPPGMPGSTAASAEPPSPPPPPPALAMSGVLRRSDNRTTVWLNNQPQYGAQRSTSQPKGASTPSVTVTLPSGKKVILKAGQRYDLNEGRIKDINEP